MLELKPLYKTITLKMRKENVRYRTGFLLPKNNFLVGLGSVLNIAGVYFDYNYSKSYIDADRKALMSDWINVGEDFNFAKRTFEKENRNSLCLK